MASHRRTKSVSRQAAENYLKKASEFAKAMERSLEAQDWNAAGLEAVHAVISAGDAMLACFVGIRSAEQDHRRIVVLLRDHLGKDGDRAATHVQRVIARKNLIEYEDRLVTKKEATEMAKHVRRLLELVTDKVASGPPK